LTSSTLLPLRPDACCRLRRAHARHKRAACDAPGPHAPGAPVAPVLLRVNASVLSAMMHTRAAANEPATPASSDTNERTSRRRHERTQQHARTARCCCCAAHTQPRTPRTFLMNSKAQSINPPPQPVWAQQTHEHERHDDDRRQPHLVVTRAVCLCGLSTHDTAQQHVHGTAHAGV
jgi:hypothetical protein